MQKDKWFIFAQFSLKDNSIEHKIGLKQDSIKFE